MATLRLFQWRAITPNKSGCKIGVSIIKPIRGLEPDLETNLHSFFNLQTKIPFELLLCIQDPNDPAIEVINKLLEMHSNVNARLFTNAKPFGKNPKVSNMHVAWREAIYDLALISDSNVRVPPDYLDLLLAERIRGADLVTQAVYGADGRGFGGHLDVIHLNTFYLKATGFLEIFGYHNVLGKCMLLSRGHFEELGGLRSVRNYLAEDLVSGDRMREAGYEIKIAPQLLRQTSVITSFSGYWKRHVRWARLRKCHVPLAYASEPLLFETFWPPLLILLNPTSNSILVAEACLIFQIASNAALHQFKLRDSGAWKSFSWFIIKDVLAPIIWIGGLVSNKVHWRGHTLYLRYGGRLVSKYRRNSSLEWLRRIAS